MVNGGLRQAAVDELTDPMGLITRASSIIDSYLRGRYSLPLSSTPDEIKDCCVQITLWFALQSLGWDSEKGPDESIKTGYQDAIKWLDKLSSGKVNLAITVDATPNKHDGGPIVKSLARDPAIRTDRRI